jgi:hypothetical protein
MAEKLTRLRRRPFMAPLLIPVLALLAAAAGIYWLGTWARTTVVVFVRHGATQQSDTGDPSLSAAAERKVSGLGPFIDGVLAGRKVDDLYSADTQRARQTAAPIANEFRLPVNLLGSSDWDRLADRLRREHRGETVVVVGYASTIPGVVRDLTEVGVSLAEDEYDTLFVVLLPSPGEARVLRIPYTPGSPPDVDSD